MYSIIYHPASLAGIPLSTPRGKRLLRKFVRHYVNITTAQYPCQKGGGNVVSDTIKVLSKNTFQMKPRDTGGGGDCLYKSIAAGLNLISHEDLEHLGIYKTLGLVKLTPVRFQHIRQLNSHASTSDDAEFVNFFSIQLVQKQIKDYPEKYNPIAELQKFPDLEKIFLPLMTQGPDNASSATNTPLCAGKKQKECTIPCKWCKLRRGTKNTLPNCRPYHDTQPCHIVNNGQYVVVQCSEFSNQRLVLQKFNISTQRSDVQTLTLSTSQYQNFIKLKESYRQYVSKDKVHWGTEKDIVEISRMLKYVGIIVFTPENEGHCIYPLQYTELQQYMIQHFILIYSSRNHFQLAGLQDTRTLKVQYVFHRNELPDWLVQYYNSKSKFIIHQTPLVPLKMLKQSDKPTILKVDTITLKQNDLKKLEPAKWLNDTLIDAYLSLLPKKWNDVGVVSTHALRNGLEHIKPTRFIQRAMKGKKILQLRYIFFPCHLQNLKHWSLIIVDNTGTHKTIRYVDSLFSKKNAQVYKSYCTQVKAFLEKIVPESRWIIKLDTQTPQQKNGFDCGAYVCATSWLTCMGIPLSEVNPNNMAATLRRLYRTHIGLSLHEGRIVPHHWGYQYEGWFRLLTPLPKQAQSTPTHTTKSTSTGWELISPLHSTREGHQFLGLVDQALRDGVSMERMRKCIVDLHKPIQVFVVVHGPQLETFEARHGRKMLQRPNKNSVHQRIWDAEVQSRPGETIHVYKVHPILDELILVQRKESLDASIMGKKAPLFKQIAQKYKHMLQKPDPIRIKLKVLRVSVGQPQENCIIIHFTNSPPATVDLTLD